MFDIQQFLEDYNIPYWIEGKNTGMGWINIQCPFCNDHSNHGGFNIQKEYYNCWKCQFHKINEVICKLLNVSFSKANQIIKQYETIIHIKKQYRKKQIFNKELKYPKGTKKLKDMHKNYLEKRNFDPELLEKTWQLKGTNHIGDYRFRIIAPIIINKKPVSYIGRDITDKSSLRYKTCTIQNEVIHHKNILYGLDFVQNRKTIIVEGITDVWKIGKGAVALFGTNYTKKQVLKIIHNIDTAFIMLDNDAEKQANKLSFDLAGLIKHIEIIHISMKDPASMKQEDANYLKKTLLGYI